MTDRNALFDRQEIDDFKNAVCALALTHPIKKNKAAVFCALAELTGDLGEQVLPLPELARFFEDMGKRIVYAAGRRGRA